MSSLPSSQSKSEMHAVLTVSQLTAQIKGVVEELFNNVYVAGEISNAKAYPSGHWYFSLKDKDSTIPCVCFRSANANIKFKLEDGLMVVLQGNLSIYPPKGAYQLVANTIEPVGIGEWQLAFEQLKAALEKEGLLDPARKRAIPTMPRRVGVVTSTQAAALRDILSALSRRNRNVNVVISHARVQGEGSAEEIAQAIQDLQDVPGIDVIIVARGGGSIEDLWAFNTDVVARAVASSKIPIVSGVGHETDVTICDLVADLRAPTPTAAAELVAKGTWELIEKYRNYQQQLIYKVDQRLTRASRALERLSPLNALARYQSRLQQYQLRVAHHRTAIDRAISHLLLDLEHRWQKRRDKLLALAPTNVLKRGFAIIRKADGSVVCDSSSVEVGEELQAILKSGSFTLRVEEIVESPISSPDIVVDPAEVVALSSPLQIEMPSEPSLKFESNLIHIEQIALEDPLTSTISLLSETGAPNEDRLADASLASDFFDGNILKDTESAELEIRQSQLDAENLERAKQPQFETRADAAKKDGTIFILESPIDFNPVQSKTDVAPLAEMEKENEKENEKEKEKEAQAPDTVDVPAPPNLVATINDAQNEPIQFIAPEFLLTPATAHRPKNGRRSKPLAVSIAAEQLSLFGAADDA